MITRFIARLRLRIVWSWQGFAHAWRTEPSIREWAVAHAISTSLALLLPLTGGERALILAGGFFVLAAECLNTAIERTIDRIGEERHPLSGQAKDTGSAAVAVMAVGMAVAWVVILLRLIL